MIIRIWPAMPTATNVIHAQRGAGGLVSLDRMYRTTPPHPPRPPAKVAAVPPRRTADEALEKRSTRQQRGRQGEPDEHEADGRPGKRVVANPPRLLGGFLLRRGFLGCLRRVGHRTKIYRCVKFGGRFSVNAFMPSVWSSVANAEWKSLRSYRSP